MPINPGKVVFLDRDGVINRDSADYIKSWSEFEFLPGSLEALRLLKTGGFNAILITNQSAVARGMITEDELKQLHRRMQAEIAGAGGRISDVYYCPHMPDAGCLCRKPKPGMIEKARREHHIDLKAAVMVGDSSKDILCARHAAVGRAILVKTGNGASAQKELADLKIAPDHIAADLLAAVRWLMNP